MNNKGATIFSGENVKTSATMAFAAPENGIIRNMLQSMKNRKRPQGGQGGGCRDVEK